MIYLIVLNSLLIAVEALIVLKFMRLVDERFKRLEKSTSALPYPSEEPR